MKMTRSLVILVSFLFVNAIVANAQKKVKYKDLIILLNAKQYDQAEPFLKRYIKDNNDNPNAYLFLGIIFQEKALKADVLKETELAIQYADSAVLNLEIANKTIDEREVRRNDEYYQVYNRRDLRTGEFGVTLSDVKLDIEKRLTLTKERKQNVRKLKDYFIQAEQQYISSVKRFQEIKQGLPENKFYLLSNEKTKESLHNFTLLYDSFTTAFDNYKAISKITIKTGYNQVLKFVPIKSYDTDGLGATDFMKDEVPVWNFKAWANSAADVIANDIEPMRIELTKTDLQLNLLGEKV
jgi:tetratricopeptide (TPR) repeat protein